MYLSRGTNLRWNETRTEVFLHGGVMEEWRNGSDKVDSRATTRRIQDGDAYSSFSILGAPSFGFPLLSIGPLFIFICLFLALEYRTRLFLLWLESLGLHMARHRNSRGTLCSNPCRLSYLPSLPLTGQSSNGVLR
ncbi:hypothetical protein PAXRUDRAFT_603983 [Paxillus rubicundulus Ve08.2h10]|uniref:Uncharacterized protein n=1 Tax=Paxillus rubicundulus Ve08.2h10 TaxID=930991 RepID=A0A0D0BP49_9AGAM|nr:hypothetical protein PAXRUDRAFT_603983 [Paxillus rubicundulus Ve08.2h10]